MRMAMSVVLAAGLGVGLASSGLAQDSVSAFNGLPGDAVSAYQGGGVADTRQVVRFVVDLPAKSSSWLSSYALGPVVKASKSNAGGYFDQLIGAVAASNRFSTGSFFTNDAYGFWTASPGTGVNVPQNNAWTSSFLGLNRTGQQFGVAFMEYGAGSDGAFGSGDDENSVIGAVVNSQYRRPNRLFVQRIAALHNKSTTSSSGTASFGVGGVDSAGNVHLLADGFSMTVPQRLNVRALIRTNLGARQSSVVNQVLGSGVNVLYTDSGAMTTVRAASIMQTVPTIISATLPGGLGRAVMLATDLANNFVFEGTAGSTTQTTAYLPAGTGSPRGSLAFVPQVHAPVAATSNPIGTAATLVRTDTNTKTRGIQVFGVSSNGSVGGQAALTLPTINADLFDRDDSFSPGTAHGTLSGHEFAHYASQATFRGGNSQVALVQLSGGDLLVAATVAATGGGSALPQSQDNYIAVARVPAAGGAPTWTIAAHTGGATGFAGGQSKAIFGRSTPGGPLTVIGRLARYTEVFGSAATGPSISSPAIDRGGNVYFISTIALTGTSGTTFTTGLLRANLDTATNGYKLELLAAVGDVLPGVNSGRNFQIQFLGVADADSIDSGSVFSSGVVQDSIAGAAPAAAPYGSELSLGALAFRAKIVYDINADTVFADPSGAGSGSTSPDQAYNVVMALMPRVPLADFNRDGVVSVSDVFDFLNSWFAAGLGADWNGDGTIAVTDIFEFLNDWFTGG